MRSGSVLIVMVLLASSVMVTGNAAGAGALEGAGADAVGAPQPARASTVSDVAANRAAAMMMRMVRVERFVRDMHPPCEGRGGRFPHNDKNPPPASRHTGPQECAERFGAS
jgi:hypothetical protein